MNKKIVKKIDIKINSNKKKISGSIFKTCLLYTSDAADD